MAYYPITEEDPIEKWEDRITTPRLEHKEETKDFQFDRLESVSAGIEGQLETTSIYPNARALKEAAYDKAMQEFADDQVTPTDERIKEVTKNWMKRLYREEKRERADIAAKSMGATAAYHYIEGEDVEGTEYQHKAWKDPSLTWYWNDGQAKRRVLREEAQKFIDPETYSRLASTVIGNSVADIIKDPDIPERIKRRLEHLTTQPNQGPPKKEVVAETVLQWAGKTSMTILGAPSRYPMSYTANLLEQRIDAGWGIELEERATGPDAKEITYIDSLGTLASKGLSQADLLALPPKWILGKGVRDGRIISYPNKKVNPEYEKELKKRMGGELTRTQEVSLYGYRDVYGEDVEKRTLGLTEEQAAKVGYDRDIPRALGSAYEGFWNDPSASKLAEQLHRFRNHAKKAAARNIEQMSWDDPRRDRYFGKSDEERERLSVKMAVKRFGKPVTPAEYKAKVQEYLSQLSATTGRFHKFGMREPEVMVEEATREQKQKAIAHAEDYFKGRVNREQLLLHIDAIYKEYPEIKMMSDMLRLDTFEDAMNNPELTELLHQVILDPLWVTGPVKAVRGIAMLGRGVATGYGMAKVGRFGTPISKFATGAGTAGTAVREFVPSAARGARQGVVLRAQKKVEAANEARLAVNDAVNDIQRIEEKILRQEKGAGYIEQLKSGAVPPAELKAAQEKAVEAGRALKKARAQEATARRIAGVPEAFDAVKKTTEASYQKVSEAFRHFTKSDRDYKTLGALRDDVGMMSRAAEDAGHGASAALRSLGDDILSELSLAKTEQEQDVLHKILSGEFRAAFEGPGATLKPSEAMKELLKNPKMSAEKQIEILTKEAVRTQHLPKSLAKVPARVRAMSDEFYDLARKAGQLSKVEKGVIGMAKHVLNYIPRWLKDTEKIHDDVIGLGLKLADGKEVEHLGEAAALINPKYHARGTEITDAIKKVVGPGERVTMTGVVDAAEELMSEQGFKTISDAWSKMGLSESEIRLLNEVRDSREAIAKVARAQDINPEQYFREIASVRKAMDDADYLGVMSDLKAPLQVLKKFTGKAAVERRPIGDLYYWKKNPLKQFEAYIKDLSTRAGTTAEVKELGRAFGVDNVAGILSNNSMIKISAQGIAEKGAARTARISELEDIWSTHHGIQMVALGQNMSQDVAKVLLPAGTKLSGDAVAFVPKVVANRLQNLLMITPAARETHLYKALDHFRSAWVRPINSIFRTTATVLRSGSFQAVNYHGAVGLGYVGLGVQALNPKLQAGAHRVALSAALGGSDIAKGARILLPRSPTGEALTLGEAMDIMGQYGLLNQGMMKYGLDISAGRGLLSVPANLLSRTARKFKLQQTAEFSDNYQKAVLFMGHLRSTSKKDIYRTLDFVSEYGQNYNRMTPFEKSAMRDMFTFYTWNRFILPHLAKQIYKNPNRLQMFERVKDTIEYNNRYERPETGLGTPAWAWMQGAVTAPRSWQPKPGQAGPNEYSVMMMETPIASTSALAGGFMGETPLHAQLGPVPRAIMALITGGDYGTGHVWEKPFRMPGLDDFNSPSDAMDYLYEFNDSRAGRATINMLPFGGAFLNIIKMYHREGMYSEAAEMFMRHKAYRDFQGLDWLIAPLFGMKPLSTPPFIEVGGYKIPTLGAFRPYSVRTAATPYRRSKEFEGRGQLLEIPKQRPKTAETTLKLGE